MFKKLISIHELIVPKISSKTFSGSVERYWNEHLSCLYIFLKKFCFNKLYPQSVLKHSLVHFEGIGMKFLL